VSGTTKARKAAGAKPAAARGEQGSADKTFTWRTLDFTLPPRLPASIAFDMVEIETGSLGALFRFLKGLLGPDQLEAIRNKLDADDVPLDDLETVLSEIMNAALDPYGLSLGESEASPAS
jgi:hypothetical protein